MIHPVSILNQPYELIMGGPVKIRKSKFGGLLQQWKERYAILCRVDNNCYFIHYKSVEEFETSPEVGICISVLLQYDKTNKEMNKASLVKLQVIDGEQEQLLLKPVSDSEKDLWQSSIAKASVNITHSNLIQKDPKLPLTKLTELDQRPSTSSLMTDVTTSLAALSSHLASELTLSGKSKTNLDSEETLYQKRAVKALTKDPIVRRQSEGDVSNLKVGESNWKPPMDWNIEPGAVRLRPHSKTIHFARPNSDPNGLVKQNSPLRARTKVLLSSNALKSRRHVATSSFATRPPKDDMDL